METRKLFLSVIDRGDMREKQVSYDGGTFKLRIIGDPNRLLDVPIAYYSARAFDGTSIGLKQSRSDKMFASLRNQQASQQSIKQKHNPDEVKN